MHSRAVLFSRLNVWHMKNNKIIQQSTFLTFALLLPICFHFFSALRLSRFYRCKLKIFFYEAIKIFPHVSFCLKRAVSVWLLWVFLINPLINFYLITKQQQDSQILVDHHKHFFSFIKFFPLFFHSQKKTFFYSPLCHWFFICSFRNCLRK